jgi:hypothetical protein
MLNSQKEYNNKINSMINNLSKGEKSTQMFKKGFTPVKNTPILNNDNKAKIEYIELKQNIKYKLEKNISEKEGKKKIIKNKYKIEELNKNKNENEIKKLNENKNENKNKNEIKKLNENILYYKGIISEIEQNIEKIKKNEKTNYLREESEKIKKNENTNYLREFEQIQINTDENNNELTNEESSNIEENSNRLTNIKKKNSTILANLQKNKVKLNNIQKRKNIIRSEIKIKEKRLMDLILNDYLFNPFKGFEKKLLKIEINKLQKELNKLMENSKINREVLKRKNK